ncbi:MAG: hypothetical protein HYX69_07680 [Planctomycetia bacterium]|nr:hypothetical protein [Planctomycetia bacterium]
MTTPRIDGCGNRRTSFVAFLSFAGITSLLFVWPAYSHAVELHPGDIVVAGFTALSTPGPVNRGIVRIDPATGERTIISDDAHGAGPPLSFPQGITLSPDGSIFVADPDYPAVFRVDPATGDRTIVGSGSPLDTPYGIKQVGNRLLVADAAYNGVISLDPVTGVLTPFSKPGVVGSGGINSFIEPVALLQSGNDVLVANFGRSVGITRVDLATGNRSTLSGFAVGTGRTLSQLTDLAFDLTGNLLEKVSGRCQNRARRR